MRKLYIFGLIALAAIIIGLAWADQMTFTTYYPAPYGVYNDMRVMNSLGVGTTDPGTARLAVIGGDVGIGTTDPNRTLHIAGTEGMRLEPSARPDPADEGDIVIDEDDNNILKWFDGTDWRPVGGRLSVALVYSSWEHGDVSATCPNGYLAVACTEEVESSDCETWFVNARYTRSPDNRTCTVAGYDLYDTHRAVVWCLKID